MISLYNRYIKVIKIIHDHDFTSYSKLCKQSSFLLQLLPRYVFNCISGQRFHASKVSSTHAFAPRLQLSDLTGVSNRTAMFARRDAEPCIY